MTTQPDLFADAGTVDQVRCISLWQPWASLMACGVKYIETRHWDTHVRGTVYIHASKTFEGLKACDGLTHLLVPMEHALGIPFEEWARKLPFGKIIAKGDLHGTMPSVAALARHSDQEPFGNFAPGRFGHLYRHLQSIDPIPYRGAQGFFFASLPSTDH